MDEKIKISLIIPAFNVEKYIRKCLDSVINQSFADFEVLCYDDNSTDKTAEIIKLYSKNDSRIIFKSISETGQGIIRNHGIKSAKAEFIAFVDADDFLHQNMLEKLYKSAVRNESDIAFCHANCVNIKGESVKYPYFDKQKKIFKKFPSEITFNRNEITPFLADINVVCWNKIYRKSFLIENEIYFESGQIHEDIPFYFSCFKNLNKISLVNESLYNYLTARPESTTISLMSKSKRLIEILDITERNLEKNSINSEFLNQFYIFKARQILSFIHYVFHRLMFPKFVKLYYFAIARNELLKIDKEIFKRLNFDERIQIWCIFKKKVKLFRLRTLYDAAKNLSDNFTKIWKIWPLVWDIIKIIYFKIVFKFKTTKTKVL